MITNTVVPFIGLRLEYYGDKIVVRAKVVDYLTYSCYFFKENSKVFTVEGLTEAKD